LQSWISIISALILATVMAATTRRHFLPLAEQGIGANLQHYNPLIDEDVQRTWNVPASWKLRGQMNFGAINAPAGEKTYIDDDKRFIIAK